MSFPSPPAASRHPPHQRRECAALDPTIQFHGSPPGLRHGRSASGNPTRRRQFHHSSHWRRFYVLSARPSCQGERMSCDRGASLLRRRPEDGGRSAPARAWPRNSRRIRFCPLKALFRLAEERRRIFEFASVRHRDRLPPGHMSFVHRTHCPIIGACRIMAPRFGSPHINTWTRPNRERLARRTIRRHSRTGTGISSVKLVFEPLWSGLGRRKTVREHPIHRLSSTAEGWGLTSTGPITPTMPDSGQRYGGDWSRSAPNHAIGLHRRNGALGADSPCCRRRGSTIRARRALFRNRGWTAAVAGRDLSSPTH